MPDTQLKKVSRRPGLSENTPSNAAIADVSNQLKFKESIWCMLQACLHLPQGISAIIRPVDVVAGFRLARKVIGGGTAS